MAVDPENGLVTDLMFGMMLAFGADIILFVGLLWILDATSATTFVTVTVAVVATFGGWIAWRWWQLRQLTHSDDPDRTPLDELKHQYAAGEITDAEFERKLDRLVDTDETVDGEPERTLQ